MANKLSPEAKAVLDRLRGIGPKDVIQNRNMQKLAKEGKATIFGKRNDYAHIQDTQKALKKTFPLPIEGYLDLMLYTETLTEGKYYWGKGMCIVNRTGRYAVVNNLKEVVQWKCRTFYSEKSNVTIARNCWTMANSSLSWSPVVARLTTITLSRFILQESSMLATPTKSPLKTYACPNNIKEVVSCQGTH